MRTLGGECEFCAAVDIAVSEPDGMGDIRDLKSAKQVLHRAAFKLSAEELVARISRSRFPEELMLFLPHVYGERAVELRPVALALSSGCADLDEDARTAFGDLFFKTLVREHIGSHNYVQALTDLHRAYPGWSAHIVDEAGWLRLIKHTDELAGLSASLACVEELLNELYTAMREENLVPLAPPSLRAVAIGSYLSVHRNERNVLLNTH